MQCRPPDRVNFDRNHAISFFANSMTVSIADRRRINHQFTTVITRRKSAVVARQIDGTAYVKEPPSPSWSHCREGPRLARTASRRYGTAGFENSGSQREMERLELSIPDR
jgi:hypothetical protein